MTTPIAMTIAENILRGKKQYRVFNQTPPHINVDWLVGNYVIGDIVTYPSVPIFIAELSWNLNTRDISRTTTLDDLCVLFMYTSYHYIRIGKNGLISLHN